MKAKERLEILKSEFQIDATTEKFIAITNPRNTSLMQSVVAWTCCPINFDGDVEVDDNCSMDDLWGLTSVDMREFAATAGLDISEAIPKMKQMANLGLIFPDGTAHSKAISIIRVYVTGKVKKY